MDASSPCAQQSQPPGSRCSPGEKLWGTRFGALWVLQFGRSNVTTPRLSLPRARSLAGHLLTSSRGSGNGPRVRIDHKLPPLCVLEGQWGPQRYPHPGQMQSPKRPASQVLNLLLMHPAQHPQHMALLLPESSQGGEDNSAHAVSLIPPLMSSTTHFTKVQQRDPNLGQLMGRVPAALVVAPRWILH